MTLLKSAPTEELFVDPLLVLDHYYVTDITESVCWRYDTICATINTVC